MRIDGNDFIKGKKAPSSADKPVNSAEKITTDFQNQLESIDKEIVREKLDDLLFYVDQYGEKLKKTMEKEDLLEYKRRVKDFLRLVQKEFARARQSFSWDSSGNLKTYTTIEKINQNLAELQEKFVQDQADVLEVVRKIDEIRGLLLDLYI